MHTPPPPPSWIDADPVVATDLAAKGWSVSLHNNLKGCAKKVWFGRIGSAGGHRWNAPTETRMAFLAKKATNAKMYIGVLTHTVIGAALSRQSVDVDAWMNRIKNRVREDLDRSIRWTDRPAHRLPSALFLEHLRGEDPVDPSAITQSVQGAFGRYLLHHHDVLSRQERIQIEASVPLYRNGIRIWMIPDLVISTEDGIGIVDWKTGLWTDRFQIAAYAVGYAWKNPDIPIEHLYGRSISLHPEGKTVELRMTDEAPARIDAVLRDDLSRLAALSSTSSTWPANPTPAGCRACPYHHLCPDAHLEPSC